MLSGKRILVAEDNDWIAEALVQTITDYRGIALGPAQTNVAALALIDDHLDGANGPVVAHRLAVVGG